MVLKGMADLLASFTEPFGNILDGLLVGRIHAFSDRVFAKSIKELDPNAASRLRKLNRVQPTNCENELRSTVTANINAIANRPKLLSGDREAPAVFFPIDAHD